MPEVLNHTIAAWSTLLLVIMQLAYKHEGKLYKNGKGVRIEESKAFKMFYLWVRLVQLPAILVAIYLGMGSFLQSDILKIIGICCSVLATAVFVHSKTTLGRNYSPCYDSYLPIEIVDRGIYRYIRHPIYVSNILNFAAMFLFSGSYLVGLNLLGLIYFYTRSARLEEVRLKAAFTEYASYVNRSGMFLPNLRQLLRL